MAMDSLLASLWPGPAPAPAPAEDERVFSYWDAPSDNTAAAPAAPAVDIDVYDEARLAPRPVQRAGSYDTDDLTDAELAQLGRAARASNQFRRAVWTSSPLDAAVAIARPSPASSASVRSSVS